MTMKIRSVTPEEYNTEMKRLWGTCFPEDDAEFIDYYFQKRTRRENVLAAFEGNTLLGGLHLIEKTAVFFGVPKKTAFIAGVATFQEYRRQGVARALMAAAEAHLKERGVSAALLQPFSFPFYEQFGYEAFAYRNEYELIPADLTDCKKSTFESLHVPTAAELSSLYSHTQPKYTGLFLRSEEDFSLLLEEARISGDFVLANTTAYAWGHAGEEDAELYELFGEASESLAKSVAHTLQKKLRFALPVGTESSLRVQNHPAPFNMIKVFDGEEFSKNLPAPPYFWRFSEYRERVFGLDRY